MDGRRGDADGATLSDTDVLEALARILSSRVVSRAARTSAFLEYVVIETVAGRSGRLKERVIGRRALDVPPTYDSRLDPSVRVRAARVRRALQAYYADEGLHDPVLIEIPRGAYVPQFRWRTPGPTAMPPGPTSLAVEVHAPGVLGADDASELRARLVASLREYPALEVADDEGGATRYRLRVAVRGREDHTWSVTVRDAAVGSLVWQETARGSPAAFDMLVARIPAAIGDYGGLITRRAVQESAGSAGGLAARATLLFYRYAETHRIEDLIEAISSMEAAISEAGDNILLLAYTAAAKAELVLSGAAAEPALSEAGAHLSRARTLDPTHPAIPLAEALVSLALGRLADAAADVRSILSGPALDPVLAFAAGVILAAAGQVDQGTALVREFDRQHPASAGYQHVYLTTERLEAEDYSAAMAHAMLVPLVAEVRPLLHAVALDAIGQRPHALAVLDRLPSPDLARVDHWASVLARRWDIPLRWRDTLLVRVSELLSPGTPVAGGPSDVDATGSRVT